MSTSPIGSGPAASGPAATSTNSPGSQAAVDALGSPDTFLQLLVAQLKYQDPESPADGTAFVTQLATFSGVEQQSQMRSDLDAINDAINQIAQKYAASQTAPTTSTSS